jgi:antibiotic biosynthesis monooxygenase (ABM) superfamily enzyme
MDEEVVHVAITRRVRAEHVSSFEKALAEFARDSLEAPGTRGVQFLYPAPGSGSLEYGILRTFSNREAREAFYQSPLYQQWQDRVRHMVEGDPTCRDLHGLEAWFRDPGSGQHPPRWKMALVTWSAVWPVSMIIPAIFLPFIQSFPHILRAGIISAGITATLTWVAMPQLVKLARRWLQP